MSEPEDDGESANSAELGAIFPRPHETIYSICARFAAANSFPNEKASSLYLLGHTRGGFHHEIPYGLRHLQSVSNGRLEPTFDLIKDRTVLSCIFPFMTAQRRKAMSERMLLSVVPNSSRAMVGMSWKGNDAHHFLRRCPDCVFQDRNSDGFTYWHVQHQLLGVWTCPVHGRPLQWLTNKYRGKYNWRQAERDDTDFEETTADACTLLALDKLAKAILWTSTMNTISSNVLNILVRSRLRRTGLVHTEIKITSTEMANIHESLAGLLTRTGISHFTRFSSPKWVKEVLVDSRASHPLRWAILIASTLGDDYFRSDSGSGGHAVKSTEEVSVLLNHDYRNALERTPQPPLFKVIYRPRISRAPDALYRALNTPMQLKDAAAFAGLSLNEARIWVRRDKKLASHWHNAISSARIQEAADLIHGYLRENPTAQRVDVHRTHLRSVRLLERYDHTRLQSLLPSAWSKFNWQLKLPFDVDDSDKCG